MVNKIKHGVKSMSFCREIIKSDDFIPVHRHGKEEEIIYIQNGNGLLVLGENKFQVKEGSVCICPQLECGMV
ncbi:MAG: cupin domain-containing protein, partial [Bacteroidales bacterium]|nr:cupin domain-containing protein [Bacteroidales bacterium]